MPTKKPTKKATSKRKPLASKKKTVQTAQKIVAMPTQQPKTNGFAIASLVLGIAFFIPFTSILAIIFGIIGLDDLKKKKQQGKGLAITGIILGSVFFVVKLLGILFLMAAAMSFAQAGL